MAAQTPGDGIYPTPSGELPVAEAFPEVPPGTPGPGYFIVPEGEAGQIVNAMTTALHADNPKDLLSISGIRSAINDTIQSVKQTIALATGTTTAWTVVHATSASQVLFLENSGLTYYPTRAAAQQQASAQNRNVDPSGQGSNIPNPLSGLAAIGAFFNKLGEKNTWVRVGEFACGAILVAIGLNSMLKGKPLSIVTGAAGKVGKAAML